MGCTRTAYSLWEINRNTIPLYYLNKISNEYNINIDYLVDLSNDKYIKFEKTEIDRVKLGKKIKEARKSINYTQEKLALKLNTTHSVISAYESGKSTVSTLGLSTL
ncbi:MAG: helix-turn-helix transcriptional regulator [Erysipelothrix sp.]|nr:helix-turn-helix transcriptional regulator [Erysipelothrix sp.]